jgi:hypothetical protein
MADADRICWDCVHCWIDYDPGYSEYTPGEGLTAECRKRHWNVRPRDLDRESLRKALQMAPTCADYTEETKT